MIKLVAKQKIGFRNPETQEIVTAEPYAFSTLPDWVEKDPMYGWALADDVIEVAVDNPPAEGDGDKKSGGKKSGGKKGDKDQNPQQENTNADDPQEGKDNPHADGDGEKKE